ncbi:hypothetical protein, conserved [Plasmodium gonderi]|uniref:Uncharacterized protein n=1 Tax=Plasmodium gonderi TaxID=77519 RepID=A0A1Y1JMX5_PLAGO|nr:hypothetical protein, conserved [Plasmodium gonderi]GAW83590.1 hypothetical protein, conserved [Plasmodium gonderi]
MACINEGEPMTPRVKFRTVQKIKNQKYISEQAYLIPENDGTAVYLSYELNRTLENIFNKYSINGYMGINEFVRMCYDYNLLPKNKNKDILYYIFKSSNLSDVGYIEYRYFFQLLQKLSAYLFRKLIMTEQEKLNVLIKHLTSLNNSKINTSKEKFNVGIQVSVKKENRGCNAVCDMIDQCCVTSVEVKDVGTGIDTRDIEWDKKIGEGEKESNGMIYENISTNSYHTLKFTSPDEQEMKERINEIEKLYFHKEDINIKLKEEINHALNIIEEKNKVIENMNKKNAQQLKIERNKIIQLKNEIQKLQKEKQVVVDLEEMDIKPHPNYKNREMDDKVELRNTDMEYIKCKNSASDYLKLKRLLVLPGEEEAALIKVFSTYSTYCGETAEYVMSKKLCANFLATYYLLRKNGECTKQEDLDVRTAEILFTKVLCQRAHIEKTDLFEGALSYFYFKLFLCNLGKHLYPDLDEREGFLEIVLNYILVLKRNEDFKNWKKKSMKIKKKNKIRIACSNDLSMLRGDIVGSYTSSEKGMICDELKKNKYKIKQSNSTNANKSMSENVKTRNFHTDLSFEYIESNETKKKKDKIREGKVKNKNEKISDSITKDNTNLLKNNIKYNNLCIYDETSNEECNSLDSVHSDDHNFFPSLPKKKNIIMKPLKMKQNILTLPKKNYTHFANTHTKRNNSVKNMFPLYDIEGELWHSKSERHKTFLPQFGKD